MILNNIYYNNKEEDILKAYIREEINEQGMKPETLITPEMYHKQNKLIVICGLLSFINLTAMFIVLPIIAGVLIELLILLVYFLRNRKNTAIETMSKEAIANPDRELAEIVRKGVLTRNENIIPKNIRILIAVGLGIVLPCLVFMRPRVIYFPTEGGVNVARYTKGIISESDVTIPKEFLGKKVVGIGKGAFAGSQASVVTLPKGLEVIHAYAFMNCRKLESIGIPSTVEEIRANTFEGDENLVSVEISNGVKMIRGSAFKDCSSLKDIVLPESLEYLGALAFSGCSSLTEIKIPEKVTEINGQTFEYCTSLKKVELHDKITSIHGEVFKDDASLEAIELPVLIKEIRGNTFEGCSSLKRIEIPEGVTRIAAHAFMGCYNLEEAIVPSTVTEIGSSAFRECVSLEQIEIPQKCQVNEKAFKNSPTNVIRY